jgi:gas vesicle protein
MNDYLIFIAGILIGLVIGGFIGILAMALVAAGSGKRSPSRPEARLPTG